ncbi:MAG TPA: DUF6580 family putative transport protein [Terriglobales bacterium]|nr:DUF6580 family putative transport protein [Terriglobales bacterium]
MSERTWKSRPLALSLIFLGSMLRLAPHPPNFAPVGALSLYSGARLRSWQAYLIPVLVLALTDPMLSVIFRFKAFTALTPFVYGSFLINVWIGRRLRQTERIWCIGGAVLLGSLQFFLITNFAVWATGHWYPHTLAGLGECYLLAIPFFAFTLAGDAAYATLLFGLHARLSQKYFPQERVASQPVLP